MPPLKGGGPCFSKPNSIVVQYPRLPDDLEYTIVEPFLPSFSEVHDEILDIADEERNVSKLVQDIFSRVKSRAAKEQNEKTKLMSLPDLALLTIIERVHNGYAGTESLQNLKASCSALKKMVESFESISRLDKAHILIACENFLKNTKSIWLMSYRFGFAAIEISSIVRLAIRDRLFHVIVSFNIICSDETIELTSGGYDIIGICLNITHGYKMTEEHFTLFVKQTSKLMADFIHTRILESKIETTKVLEGRCMSSPNTLGNLNGFSPTCLGMSFFMNLFEFAFKSERIKKEIQWSNRKEAPKINASVLDKIKPHVNDELSYRPEVQSNNYDPLEYLAASMEYVDKMVIINKRIQQGGKEKYKKIGKQKIQGNIRNIYSHGKKRYIKRINGGYEEIRPRSTSPKS